MVCSENVVISHMCNQVQYIKILLDTEMKFLKKFSLN